MYLSLQGENRRAHKGVTAISPLDRGPISLTTSSTALSNSSGGSSVALFPQICNLMPVSSTLTLQKHKPEVVTTSNRIQESCI